jgi:hypothetical protein
MAIPGRELQKKKAESRLLGLPLSHCSMAIPGRELQKEKAESRHAGISPYFFFASKSKLLSLLKK